MIKLKLIVVSRLIVVYAIRRKCLHLAGLFFLHFARFNPYRPGVLFVGHGQSLQTQIRRCRTLLFAYIVFY